MGARIQRAERSRLFPAVRFDVEIGVGSLVTNSSSFGLLVTNAHKLVGTNHYSVEWELPNTFYQDAEARLDGANSLLLSNRVSSVCGQTYSATDTPEAAWPWDKKYPYAGGRHGPADSARPLAVIFVLVSGDSPLNGTWDIVFRAKIIASSGQPNGWMWKTITQRSVDSIVTVPANVVPDKAYEIRIQQAGWNARPFSTILKCFLRMRSTPPRCCFRWRFPQT